MRLITGSWLRPTHKEKGEAGKNLIRAIFGTDAIAEDSLSKLPRPVVVMSRKPN